MSELAELERDMGDVRELAASAGAEVGDVHARLRAHTKSLEALRETQLEQSKEMREGFADVRSEMRQGFATMGVGMAQINALLKIIIDQSGDES